MLATQILLALAAGLALNLTPCVLPAIPIKLRMIMAAVGANPAQRLLSGLALLAGTWTFFGLAALAASGLGWNWGELFQYQAVRLTLAALLAGLGVLSLTGRGFTLPTRLYHLSGHGYAEPYLAGLLAALLSTPCTGPFLGGVLVFAVTQPASHTLAIFLAIGLGLALPYLLLIAVPGLLARLPRAGAWSARVHQALGLILLAGAVFFAATDLPATFAKALWAGLSMLTLAWTTLVLWRGPDLKARAVPLVLAALVTPLVPLALGAHAQDQSLPWQPFSTRALEAARSANRPVLVEFTADWCINCKVLERTVYRTPELLRAARAADLVTLRIDLTSSAPDLEMRLRAWGGAGIPFAVVLGNDGQVVQTLPDLFRSKDLIQAIETSVRMNTNGTG